MLSEKALRRSPRPKPEGTGRSQGGSDGGAPFGKPLDALTAERPGRPLDQGDRREIAQRSVRASGGTRDAANHASGGSLAARRASGEGGEAQREASARGVPRKFQEVVMTGMDADEGSAMRGIMGRREYSRCWSRHEMVTLIGGWWEKRVPGCDRGAGAEYSAGVGVHSQASVRQAAGAELNGALRVLPLEGVCRARSSGQGKSCSPSIRQGRQRDGDATQRW